MLGISEYETYLKDGRVYFTSLKEFDSYLSDKEHKSIKFVSDGVCIELSEDEKNKLFLVKLRHESISFHAGVAVSQIKGKVLSERQPLLPKPFINSSITCSDKGGRIFLFQKQQSLKNVEFTLSQGGFQCSFSNGSTGSGR